MAAANRSQASGPRTIPVGSPEVSRSTRNRPATSAVAASTLGERQGEAVRGDGVARDVGQQDRPIRNRPVQVVARRVVGAVPARRVVASDQPRVRVKVLGRAGDRPHGRPPVAPGHQRHPGDEPLPVRVGVGLHESRQHGPAAQVDDVRVRPRQREHLLVAADREDPLVGVADGGGASTRRVRHARVARRAARRRRSAAHHRTSGRCRRTGPCSDGSWRPESSRVRGRPRSGDREHRWWRRLQCGGLR